MMSRISKLKKMKKWLIVGMCALFSLALTACGGESSPAQSGGAENGADSNIKSGEENTVSGEARRIKVTDEKGTQIIFALNSSGAADDLYEQLPLDVDIENYSDNEKIFYPAPLNTENAPLAQGGSGTLAYYAPWNDVVMFYGGFRRNDSLFELGKAEEGADNIKNLSGRIIIDKIE